MTNNPIDILDQIQKDCELIVHSLRKGYRQGQITFAQRMLDDLKTYRDEYISIKKSDVPECLNLAVNQLKKFNEESKITKDSFLWILHTTVNLVARAMEAKDE